MGAAIGFVRGFIMVYGRAQKHFLAQKIRNTPTSTVEAASHIDGTKCAYWKIDAQYYKSRKHGWWCSIFSCDSISTDLYLEDKTGIIFVEPQSGVSSSAGHKSLAVRKSNFDKTFFISDSSEKVVFQSVSNQVYFQIFGGLALAAVYLLILSSELNILLVME